VLPKIKGYFLNFRNSLQKFTISTQKVVFAYFYELVLFFLQILEVRQFGKTFDFFDGIGVRTQSFLLYRLSHTPSQRFDFVLICKQMGHFAVFRVCSSVGV
jgi:hypothetical protein